MGHPRTKLFVMRPHPQHFDDVFFFQNLIHKSVLDVDPARVRAFQVAD